ncbi:helix-turn-helix domain-containing protein [Kitasatospora sp. MMS16-BH015]|uniref:helix-turn-helix domain-containing protein n=1 Tax=Kitasatospora sp. MMS16-BH015 TaxID=2018025 RepID=UPI000CF267EC|nr:helix-turn-helix domain-containing protein [Kitasatospora sp. MMS16-BH015]
MEADRQLRPAPSVPDEAARAFYLAVLAEGGRIARDETAEADRESIDQLLAVGLLISNPLDRSYVAVSPREVGVRLSADLRREATRLLLRSDELPTELGALTRAYEAKPWVLEPGQQTSYVEGREEIRQRIAQLVSESKSELITVQPGPRLVGTIELALQQDLAFVRRGGSLRTLYQPVVLDQPETVSYAAAVSAHGAGIRVLDEPLERMIVIDRSIAVISAAEDHSRAAFVAEPATLAFLVRAFERTWARAEAVRWGELPDPQQRTHTQIGRLLAQGLTQRAVATRLGLSERTVAAHIARLRDRHGAQTLFQLGWAMRGE